MLRDDRTLTGTVGGGGTATLTLKTINQQTWIVQQVSPECGGAPLGSACALRKNGYLITPMLAAGDAAGGDPPLLLLPSDTMTIEWVGCTPGAAVKAYIAFEVEA